MRAIAPLLSREPIPIRCRYFGARFKVNPGDLIGDGIAINRIEWREITMMIAACREYRPDLFIDVGANIGLYSCIVGRARLVPRVVAFEPDQRNFARLNDNVERNRLTDIVQTRPHAVGATAGTVRLSPGPPENTGLSKIDNTAIDGYEVSVIKLDDAFDIQKRSIAVKIDVEGAELQVLEGAANLFSRNFGYAQIEGHGDARASEITQLMQTYGWQFIDRHGLDLRFQRRIQ